MAHISNGLELSHNGCHGRAQEWKLRHITRLADEDVQELLIDQHILKVERRFSVKRHSKSSDSYGLTTLMAATIFCWSDSSLNRRVPCNFDTLSDRLSFMLLIPAMMAYTR